MHGSSVCNNIIFFYSYQWFCHFDDDVYVNIPRLNQLLKNYSPHQPLYIGKWHGKKNAQIPVRNLSFYLLSIII